MADKGIIFSAPMVRALLDGNKTQTRRLLNPQPTMLTGTGKRIYRDEDWKRSWGDGGGNGDLPYALGDRLYVREAWAPIDRCTHNDPGTQATIDRGFYRADNSTVKGEVTHWTPSIHMPRWASRLWLSVTEVRVQRLQDISAADAIAEGIEPYSGIDPDCFGWRNYADPDPVPKHWLDAVSSFRSLWNSLHTKPGETWADNPWIVAVTFTVNQGNIDG